MAQQLGVLLNQEDRNSDPQSQMPIPPAPRDPAPCTLFWTPQVPTYMFVYTQTDKLAHKEKHTPGGEV